MTGRTDATPERIAKLPVWAQRHIKLLVQNNESLRTHIAHMGVDSDSDVAWRDVGQAGHLPPDAVVTWGERSDHFIEVTRDDDTGGVRIRTGRALVVIASSCNAATVMDMPWGWTWKVKDPWTWQRTAAIVSSMDRREREWICENCGQQIPGDISAGDFTPFCCGKPTYVLKERGYEDQADPDLTG